METVSILADTLKEIKHRMEKTVIRIPKYKKRG